MRRRSRFLTFFVLLGATLLTQLNAEARREDTQLNAEARREVKESDWWKHAVFYEIYPRSFADSNGDGVGDLIGIASKIPYLRRLGVDAVWITPCFPSPEVDFGYDVSDYLDVDPVYGTLADKWEAPLGNH
jgi:alpha-glucosidase